MDEATRFTHSATVIDRRKAGNPAQDLTVKLNGNLFGRVLYKNTGRPGSEHWAWHSQTYPASSRQAETKKEALTAIKEAITSQIEDGVLKMAGKYRI